MKRAECIAMLYPELDDKPVVTIMGACAQELYDLGHKDFFYCSTRWASRPQSAGLALHLPHEKIVVLDGDGSVLMNLGTLATLARYPALGISSTSFSTTAACSRPAASTRTRHRGSPTWPRWRGPRHRARSPRSTR